VTTEEVKRRIRIDFADDDADIDLMISAARDHAEKYCNVLFAEQGIEVKCDAWCDLALLPVAPVGTVTSITYVDISGVTQTLPSDVYDQRLDGLEPSITLAYGKQWPPVRSGSRITVTLVAGYDEAPPAVKHAILLFIAGAYEVRENEKAEDWTALDALLCNHRR
jgi:uncharacterized phiE125 gp8 family phage protein